MLLVKENELYTRGNAKIGSDISHILEYISLPEFATNINYVRGELLPNQICFESNLTLKFQVPRVGVGILPKVGIQVSVNSDDPYVGTIV